MEGVRRRLGWNGLGPALPRDVKRHKRAALSCLAAWAPQARRRRCFLAPPQSRLRSGVLGLPGSGSAPNADCSPPLVVARPGRGCGGDR